MLPRQHKNSGLNVPNRFKLRIFTMSLPQLLPKTRHFYPAPTSTTERFIVRVRDLLSFCVHFEFLPFAFLRHSVEFDGSCCIVTLRTQDESVQVQNRLSTMLGSQLFGRSFRGNSENGSVGTNLFAFSPHARFFFFTLIVSSLLSSDSYILSSTKTSTILQIGRRSAVISLPSSTSPSSPLDALRA